MRVRAEGEADLRVAEQLHNHARGHLLAEQQRRCGVARVVQARVADAGRGQQAQSCLGSMGRPFTWQNTKP
jgi:hypothetical protein